MMGPEIQELYLWLYGEYAASHPNISSEQARSLLDALIYTITLGARRDPNAGCESCYHAGQSFLREKLLGMKAEFEVLLDGLGPAVAARYCAGVRELHDFFAGYELKFAPQDSVISCSFPLVLPVCEADGIEKAESYLHALAAECGIVQSLNQDHVAIILSRWPDDSGSSPLRPILLELFSCALLRQNRLLAQEDLAELSRVLGERGRTARILERSAERLCIGAGLPLPCRQYLIRCLHVIEHDLDQLRQCGELSSLVIPGQPEAAGTGRRTLSQAALNKLALRIRRSESTPDRIKIILSYRPSIMDLLDLMDLYALSPGDFQALCRSLGAEKQMELVEKINQETAVTVRNW